MAIVSAMRSALSMISMTRPWEHATTPRACDDTTGLKLFLNLVGNEPVRRLLFYVLKFELGA